jgi:hypothetical protein
MARPRSADRSRGHRPDPPPERLPRSGRRRITTGFLFKTQLQLDYNYNFDVIREGDRGGSEVIVHVSTSF